jgi:Protein of unknown function (DUF3667)
MSVLPACANCGTALNGPYCSNCGQKASDTHRPFWWIFGEFLDSVFGYDSRTFRTLWLLFAEPGEFTRRYNAGKRASLLPPFRLFVIATLVFFITLQVTGLAMVAFKTQVISLKSLPPEAVKAIEKESNAEITFKDQEGNAQTIVTMEFFVPARSVERVTLTQAEKEGLSASDKAIKVEVDGASEDDKGWMRWLEAKIKRANEGYVRARSDPMALNGPLNVWLPRLMLVLVPIFALLLAIMHWWPKVYLFEHLVFSIHIHTVVFVALSLVAAAAAFVGHAGFLWLVWLLMAIYVWMAMYRVYQRSWWLTSLKFVALLAVYSLVLMVGLASIFFLALSEV